MSTALPVLSLIISLVLGAIITKHLTLKINLLPKLFFITTLGIILFTAIIYFNCLIFSFPDGILIGHLEVLLFEILYLILLRPKIDINHYFKSISNEWFLIFLIVGITFILIPLFHTHVIPSINGNLYTGDSTYGDLPFHLSTISHIAYGRSFPPDHPLFSAKPLVYPYLINFFSAILVYEGWSLRQAVIIPGLILSISLIGLIYDFAFNLTKSNFKSFLVVIFYFFNGGLGFYFFVKDHSFNLVQIFSSLQHPALLKEYSHLFEQNVQWGNFLSRMIVPERALLFGIPAGIIILRLLFFRGDDKPISKLDLVLVAFLASLMPLLHIHTVLAMAVILPILGILTINKLYLKRQLISYFWLIVLTILFTLPHIPQYSTIFKHLSESESFFRFHFGWMRKETESLIWFWFKNTYLLIPLSLIALLLSKKIINKQIKILQICAFCLLLFINIILLSPYDWDNVKFLFWIGLFFDIAAASFLGHLLLKYNAATRLVVIIIIMTMISTALLSILREVNVSYLLFSKEGQEVGKWIKENTPLDAVFLTYKVHNSPVSNLAGRSIVMGYPGLLWTQGINYQKREQDINQIYAGSDAANELMSKYGIKYVVIENYNPNGEYINRQFFTRFRQVWQSENYIIYQVN